MMEHREVARRMAELGMAAAASAMRGEYREAADNLRAGQMQLLGDMLEAGNVSQDEALVIVEEVDRMHAEFVAKHCG